MSTVSKDSQHLKAKMSAVPASLLDTFHYLSLFNFFTQKTHHKKVQEVTQAAACSLTCPSNMSLCSPARSCSELLVLRIERLCDLRFCFAWRADAQLPLSIGITSKKQLHRGSYDKLRTSITNYKLLYQTNQSFNFFS